RAAQVVWAMRKASAVVSVSEDLAGKLARLGVERGKISVVYNGGKGEGFQPLPRREWRELGWLRPERKHVLYIGNLKLEKGCVDLFEAFVRLAADPRVDLCYIGTGKMAATIAARAEAEGLAERVHLLGSVGHDKLVRWINACDVLSLP